MKKLFGFFALLLLVGGPAIAQENTPKIEIGGGYTFRSWGIPTVLQPPSRLKMNGWNASASWNFNPWLALALAVDGTRNDQGINGTTDIYSFLAGPQVYPLGHHRLTPFVHGLVGEGYFKLHLPPEGSFPAFNYAEGRFAWEVGGGMDLSLSRHFAVRLGEFDYEQTRFRFEEAANNQNNFKYSAGIVIRFGGY
jgi:Outer membrane protein beta-barrel domain